jgi:formate hydrogenlyase transcriptional activator
MERQTQSSISNANQCERCRIVILLEQVVCQVAIAVENTLEYEKATKDRDKETKQRLYLEEEIRAEFREIVGEGPALKTALSLV